ncbi:hypothetical protein SDC9_128835 [bioreactor metagenome]|uniref:Uncharacterized protein n=1 Tax=bioreactor metagenome TaxID=1076179 RepID=A0A645CY70_9ZZZZ
MKKVQAAIKLGILISILIFIFSFRGINGKKSKNTESEDSIFQSEVIDVSQKNKISIYLSSNTWPVLKRMDDEILVIDLVLQQSSEVSCENDLLKSNLSMRVAAFSHGQIGSYNRLVYSDMISNDTIRLSEGSTFGNTGIDGYTFAYPIGNICYLHGEEINIEIEIIEGDKQISSLNPIITVKKNSAQTSKTVFKESFYKDMLFYLILLFVFILIVLEIVYLFGDSTHHPSQILDKTPE